MAEAILMERGRGRKLAYLVKICRLPRPSSASQLSWCAACRHGGERAITAIPRPGGIALICDGYSGSAVGMPLPKL